MRERLFKITKKSRLLAAAAVSIAIVGALAISRETAQYTGDSNQLISIYPTAVSSDEREHVHSLVVRAQDLPAIIASLPDDTSTYSVKSSSANIDGAPGGVSHEHAVNFHRSDLIRLRETGSLAIQSEETLGHSHVFEFLQPLDCPGVVPSPTPSPTVSPTVSPEPSPSVSPSGEPSGEPSPEPSIEPSTVG